MTDRAPCPVCSQPRQITVSGMLRRHNQGTSLCPGSKQPPAVAVTPPVNIPGPSGPTTPQQPDEPTYGRSCDGGGCDVPSVGWRLFRTHREWLPVCGLHMDGPAGRTRIYDEEQQT